MKLKLQTRFFLTYLFMAALVLFAFAAFFYYYVSENMLEQETDNLSALTSSFRNQVDEVIRGLDSVSININYSSAVKDKLDSSFNLNISSDMLKGMADLFVTINGADTKADQINLYDFSGNILRVGLRTNTDKINTDSLPWLEETRILKGKKLISNPYKANLYQAATWSDWFISVYRTFNNQYGRPVGAVETIKRCKSVFMSIITYEKKTKNPPAIYIYSKQGDLLYPYDYEPEEASFFDYFSILEKGKTKQSYVNPVSLKAELITFETSAYTDWVYVCVQPESIILKPIGRLLQMLIFVVLILIIGCMLISYFLSRSVVRPIKHLKHIIQRIELNTLGVEKADAVSTSFNELDELNRAFQNMSENLKTSMNELIDTRQQELKSRTLALQSQINPHFYYNTISSIIVLAENNQTDEVIQICRHLTKIMRYITDVSKVNVTIATEIDYINKYLYCMKVRYQSSLNYHIDIDEALLTLLIPKLIIQPLVENAIKYGTDCLPPWELSIIGRVYEDCWRIDIIDSGNGFTKESIELMDKRMKDASENPGMPELKIDGMGMLNVYLRWKVFVGEDIIFCYKNTDDGHGMVSIGRYT